MQHLEKTPGGGAVTLNQKSGEGFHPDWPAGARDFSVVRRARGLCFPSETTLCVAGSVHPMRPTPL